jgi:hypothetical protein
LQNVKGLKKKMECAAICSDLKLDVLGLQEHRCLHKGPGMLSEEGRNEYWFYLAPTVAAHASVGVGLVL